jgi:nucleoside-diphosphate-sugar epimerase
VSSKTLLVTGASGLFGSFGSYTLAQKYQVTGLFNQHPIQIPDVDMRRLNLLDFKSVENFLREHRPDAIVHAAALVDVEYCE